MKQAQLLLPLILLSACHTMPRVAPPPTMTTDRVQVTEDAPPRADIDVPSPDVGTLQNESPPCVAIPVEPRHASKPPATVARKTQPSAEPPPVAVPAGEPAVKPIDSISLSVLGKKVRGEKGEDMGRLVDILADAQGRVRVAIIESGGFLGVGNRRIAVDWSLLKFHPDPSDSYVMLIASEQQLNDTPEYRDSHQPVALMAPNDSASSAKKP